MNGAGLNGEGLSLASFTVFDWVLVALLVGSTVRAFLRGFLREAFAIIGLVAGVLLACWNYNALAAILVRWISTLYTAQIVAFLLIAAGVMILCGLVARMLRSGASVVGLGFLDRLLGAVFGLVRGCLIGVACIMVFAVFVPETPWMENSQLAPYFLAGAHGVSFVVPHDLEQKIASGVQLLKHNATGWIKQPR